LTEDRVEPGKNSKNHKEMKVAEVLYVLIKNISKNHIQYLQ